MEILKNPAGGGGAGSATASNQKTQINQLIDSTGEPSIFKDLTNDLSVFLSGAGESVFLEPGSSTSSLNKISNTLSGLASATAKSLLTSSGTTCISFAAATPAALQILVQAFLSTNTCVIMNLSYTESGGANHHCFLTYAI